MQVSEVKYFKGPAVLAPSWGISGLTTYASLANERNNRLMSSTFVLSATASLNC